MDKILENALRKERVRQEANIELIASENYVSNDILKLQGSILTNKYAEGYPNKRYYGGCEYIDIFEDTAREYAKELFGAKFANVQPHSGSSANMAVYRALLNHGDKVMGIVKADDYRWTLPIPAGEYRYNTSVEQNDGWPKLSV